jgi:hypothetical protein
VAVEAVTWQIRLSKPLILPKKTLFSNLSREKFDPVIVSSVPPPMDPVVGVMLVTWILY